MFTSLSGELNELAIYEAGYQLSLFDSLLPDFVADVHPLVGISSDALYAAAMARSRSFTVCIIDFHQHYTLIF